MKNPISYLGVHMFTDFNSHPPPMRKMMRSKVNHLELG